MQTKLGLSLFDDIRRDAPLAEIEEKLRRGADTSVTDGDGDSPLEAALWWKRGTPLIRLLLAHTDRADLIDRKGDNALILALKSQREAGLIRDLLAKGADPNHENEMGGTPLYYAVPGDPEILRMLLRAGADPNGMRGYEETPLSRALDDEGREEAILLLAAYGADLGPGEEHFFSGSALHETARKGLLKATEGLIARGADLRSLDRLGRTPLAAALAEGGGPSAAEHFEQVIELLLRKGSDPDARDCYGMVPLMQAARQSRKEGKAARLLTLLLKAGADPRTLDEDGRSALHHRLLTGPDPAGTELLLQAGLSLNRGDREGDSPFLLGLQSANSSEERFFLLRALLAEGADINHRNRKGLGALHQFIADGESPALVNFCLEQGADPSLKTAEGLSPLMIGLGKLCGRTALGEKARRFWKNAAGPWETLLLSSAFPEIFAEQVPAPRIKALLRLLLSYGAEADPSPGEGPSALAMAAAFGEDPEVLDLLLDAGADPNRADPEGMTPLMHACRSRREPEGILLLLRRGSDPASVDNNGQTARDHLARNVRLKEHPIRKRLEIQ